MPIRTLLRANPSAGALVASVLLQGSLVVSGPATARLLGVTNRGELALLTIVGVLAVQLGGAGLPNAVAFTIAREHVSARAILGMLTTVWVRLCIGASALSAVAVVFLLHGRSSSPTWMEAILLPLWVVGFMTWQLILGCFQGEHRFLALNVLRPIPQMTVAAVLLVWWLVLHHATVGTVLGLMAATNIIGCCLGWRVLYRDSSRSLPPNLTVRPLLGYGLRSIVGVSAPVETLSLDQAVVGILLSRADLGFYAVGAAFNNLPSVLVSGLGTVALPRLAADHRRAALQPRMKKVALGALIMAAAATLFAEGIVGFVLPFAFGQAFSPAIPIARILIVAGFFFGVRRVLVVFLSAVGRPGSTALGEGLSLFALVVFAALLTPWFHLVGASTSLVLAAVVGDAYLLWTLHRVMSEGTGL
jgi:O-antigen/teichoic acid export membrane protein